MFKGQGKAAMTKEPRATTRVEARTKVGSVQYSAANTTRTEVGKVLSPRIMSIVPTWKTVVHTLRIPV